MVTKAEVTAQEKRDAKATKEEADRLETSGQRISTLADGARSVADEKVRTSGQNEADQKTQLQRIHGESTNLLQAVADVEAAIGARDGNRTDGALRRLKDQAKRVDDFVAAALTV